jgi:hypothetical protein
VRLKRSISSDLSRGKVSREVINAFLESRGRTALSLIVAWQESENVDLLNEAAERFPNEPRVQMAMLATDLTDEQRALWIARLKAGAPDNALANYYAAADHFRQKNGEAAGCGAGRGRCEGELRRLCVGDRG